jgi:hypothetical protein
MQNGFPRRRSRLESQENSGAGGARGSKITLSLEVNNARKLIRRKATGDGIGATSKARHAGLNIRED